MEDPVQRMKQLEELVASLSLKNQILEMQNSGLKGQLADLLKVKNYAKEETHVTCSCQNTLVGDEIHRMRKNKIWGSLEPSILAVHGLQIKDSSTISGDGMLMSEEQKVEGMMQSTCLKVHPSSELCSVELHESDLSEDVEKSQPLSLSKKKNKLNGGGLCWISYHTKRHIALKIFYLGSRFNGFASDAKKGVTVESELFTALTKINLWSGDPVTSHYSRCGRTDKGVSATGQVIALFLRSCQKATNSDTVESVSCMSQNFTEDGKELDYVALLNQALPNDIRVLGWSPSPHGFHSRFSCLSREYNYYFINDRNLNIEVMKAAAIKFIGDHDFRNFCKMDARNVHNYVRTIIAFDILPCHERGAGEQIWSFHIKGTSFLWHQVRCMVAVLFMIGEGRESPEVVDELLDVQKTVRKPQYKIAPSLPLVLQSCEFEGLHFKCSQRASVQLQLHLEGQRKDYGLIHAVLMSSLDQVSSSEEECGKNATYVRLMLRPTEPSYEERRSKFL